jgi:hypothetical protein
VPFACAGLQGLRKLRLPRHSQKQHGHPLLDLRPPTESSRLRAATDLPASRRIPTPRRHPPVRSLAPTASPRSVQRLHSRACLTRPPAPSGFLNLSTPSSVPSLVALFHATSALGVHPSELSSSRAAVRRLRRRSPLVVQANPGLLHSKIRPAETFRIPKHWNRPESAPNFRGLLHTRIRHIEPAV